MVDIHRSSDFEELEAARLSGDEAPAAEVVTKDVKPEQVEHAPAEVAAPADEAPAEA